MSFLGSLLGEVFGGGGTDPGSAAATVKQAADAAATTSTFDAEKIAAAARAKKRFNRDNLIIDPGISGSQNGTGLEIPI